MSARATSTSKIQFVLCIADKDADDLEKGKVHGAIPDPAGKKSGFVRVVDKSGEDYLYPESYFTENELPNEGESLDGLYGLPA